MKKKTIVVVTCKYKDLDTGITEVVVSHGVEIATLENVCLPTEDWELFRSENCHFREDLGEWVLNEPSPSSLKKNPLDFFS